MLQLDVGNTTQVSNICYQKIHLYKTKLLASLKWKQRKPKSRHG